MYMTRTYPEKIYRMKGNNLVAELETGTALLPQLPPH